MPENRPTLLRGGCVIDTEPDISVHHRTDVLIEDGRIRAVGRALPAEGAEIVDATDRIVLPGFVDTHRHLWQAVLRQTAADCDLGGYFDLVQRTLSPRLTPEDVRVGQLVGALECLDSGITTVQDYSHIQFSPEHTDAAVAGLRSAGIRAVFGYGYPFFDGDARRPDDVRRAHERHFAADRAAGGPAEQPPPLVTMALAPFGPAYAPIATVAEDWGLAAELQLPIIVHIGSGPVAERPLHTLREHGLLRPGTLYVHGNSLPDEELALLAASGGAMSITPAVEAQMGHGAPMINRLRAAGVVTGLGVDVVTTVAGDMFSLMRAALLTSQLAEGPALTAADVLRAATLDGAAALGLADRIGSLRPGKQADLVLLRTDTVGTAGAVAYDPVGAVVAAAHPGHVDTVLVAGRPVKRDGRLLHPQLADSLNAVHTSALRLAARGRTAPPCC
ncbi:amidohydrolase [Streptomyces albus subsp. albus]|nr:amidohydrolase [Streptomyces albus subsp. albus]